MGATKNKLYISRALFLGDSHIHHLYEDILYQSQGLFALNFQVAGTVTHFHGIGGRTIEKVKKHDLHMLETVRPELVFLHVGGNDLSGAPDSPAIVAHDLIALANHIAQFPFVRAVIISSFLYRHPGRYPVPPNFHAQCRAANGILISQTSKLSNKTIKVWRHKFSCGPSSMRDGVHFNAFGQKSFYKSIRDCLSFSFRGKLEWRV